jgi:hypothetical protein
VLPRIKLRPSCFNEIPENLSFNNVQLKKLFSQFDNSKNIFFQMKKIRAVFISADNTEHTYTTEGTLAFGAIYFTLVKVINKTCWGRFQELWNNNATYQENEI